eukprot:m.220568 g.220568  ORF g.220568 m.220568 type:complete len:215 (+) comp10405_c0_seq1:199-843(+)
MADNCDLLLRAAELLDTSKQAMHEPAISISYARDDFMVPDMSADEASFGDGGMDSLDEDNLQGFEDGMSKRPRLASLKGARLAARDAVAHNSVEKRRRAYLASCYDNLKRAVPSLANVRASNVKVLRAGLAQIKALEAEERRLVAEKKRAIALREQLIRQNNILAEQLFRRNAEQAVPVVSSLSPESVSRGESQDSEEVAMSLMLLAELCPVAC